jgi:hypothetical protein
MMHRCRSNKRHHTIYTSKRHRKVWRSLSNSSSNNEVSRDPGQSSHAPNVGSANYDAIGFVPVLNARNRTEPANMLWIMIPQTSLKAQIPKCQNQLDQRSAIATPAYSTRALLSLATIQHTELSATGITGLRLHSKNCQCAWKGSKDNSWPEVPLFRKAVVAG